MKSIEIPKCAECRDCCTNIPTAICAYNVLEKILKDKIPLIIQNQFVIYNVHRKYLEKAAKTWWHLPNVNLLESITTPIEEIYSFLAIPKTRGHCIFLGPVGCLFPEIKPYNCRIFPFHLFQNRLESANWCSYIAEENKDLSHKELNKIMNNLHDIVSEYRNYNEKYRDEYIISLKKIKLKLNLQNIIFK